MVAVARGLAGIDRRLSRPLARQPTGSAAISLRRAPSTRVRRLVRQFERLAGDRLRRPSVARGRMMTATVLRQTPLPDPFRAGIAGGWKVIDASALSGDLALEADVVIVGTGA